MNNKIKRNLPVEGSKDTIFKRLCGYIQPIDSRWLKRIIPGLKDDIEKLIEISRIKETGYDLPEDYIEYLKYMGTNDGGLLSKELHSNTNIRELIEWYELDAIEYPEEIRPEYFIFAVNNEVDTEYYINTKKNGKQIITSSADKIYEIDGQSENFEKFLFQVAYKKYERKYFDNVLYFSTNMVTYTETLKRLKINDIFEVVERFSKEYGFEKAWFSDEWNYIGIKGNITFYVNKLLAISGYVVGDDKEEVNRLGNILNNILGTRIQ